MTLLDGRVVIVAGAGPGLGSALGRRVVHHGGRVVLAARSAGPLEALEAALGDDALAVVADVCRRPDVDRLVAAALDRFGRVDGLVHNAAVVPPLDDLVGGPDVALGEVLAVSTDAPLHLVRAVVPVLTPGHGSVVLVGSAVVRHPKPGFGAYNVGKHALLGLARSLALELGPRGIRVNTLAPGKIGAERLDRYFGELAGQRGVSTEDVRADFVSRIALRRVPTPDEHADAAVFLLSDLSRAVTGHVLDVNGGEHFA